MEYIHGMSDTMLLFYMILVGVEVFKQLSKNGSLKFSDDFTEKLVFTMIAIAAFFIVVKPLMKQYNI